MHLKSLFSYITVITIYAPTTTVSSTVEANHPSEDFYNKLHYVLATVPHTEMTIVLGDFNTRVGTDTYSPWAPWVGTSQRKWTTFVGLLCHQ